MKRSWCRVPQSEPL